MRKRKKGRKLSREKNQRTALLKSLATALFLKEKIVTTEAKAKELRSYVEKVITKAKRGSISSRRFTAGLFSKDLTKKISNDLAPRYLNRKGGYTRIIKLGQRKVNGARMAVIEFVK